jgi:hypothetical protein
MMRDAWCRRLVLLVGVWAAIAIVLQLVVSLALR